MEAKITVDGEGSESCNVIMRFAGDVAEEEHDEEISNLKRRISAHPLFGLLIETHLNCLKVGLGDLGEVGTTNSANQTTLSPQATIPSSSELDLFMEAYCITLSKLKEALKESLQDTESFIDSMYVQLREIRETHPNTPKPNSPTP